MKNIFKKFLVFSSILLSITCTLFISPQQTAYAHDFSCRYFLGMTSWDCHVDDINNQDDLKNNIWIIVANILTDISVIAAYVVVGFVIYGGYLYMFSSGDASKVTAGKKTLTHAFIGLAIVILANIIFNAIRFALLQNNEAFPDDCAQSSCINEAALITNAINWVIGISGAVSVIFIVIGGIGYVTSSGDANKLKKAKDTIIYALIGLAIVGLAEIIVIFASNIINDANSTAKINDSQTLIAKEHYEN